jgi:hypothetical protein
MCHAGKLKNGMDTTFIAIQGCRFMVVIDLAVLVAICRQW